MLSGFVRLYRGTWMQRKLMFDVQHTHTHTSAHTASATHSQKIPCKRQSNQPDVSTRHTLNVFRFLSIQRDRSIHYYLHWCLCEWRLYVFWRFMLLTVESRRQKHVLVLTHTLSTSSVSSRQSTLCTSFPFVKLTCPDPVRKPVNV